MFLSKSKAKTSQKTKVKINDPKRKWIVVGVVAVLVFGGLGAYFVSHSNAATCQQTELYNGSRDGNKSGCVAKLQDFLNLMGYTDKDGKQLGVDGQFGPRTEQAVRKAQSAVGVAVDGRYGPKTKAALCEKARGMNNASILTSANQTACTAASTTTTSSTGSNTGSGGTSGGSSSDSGSGSDTGSGSSSGTGDSGGSTSTSSGGSGTGRTGSAPTCRILATSSPSVPKNANPQIVVTNNYSETLGSVKLNITIRGGLSGKSTAQNTLYATNISPHSSKKVSVYLPYGTSYDSVWRDNSMSIDVSGDSGGSPRCSATIKRGKITSNGPQEY